MAEDRRYDENEAEEIFAIAARSDPDTLARSPGDRDFTLDELQEIGSEAGIDPTLVEDAARSLDARGTPLPEQKFLGRRVSVGRVVPLPRRPTDDEWYALVTELRDTFAATGEVRHEGGARQWSNGALKVLLEPTASGHQLRLTSVNRRFRSLTRMGVALAVWGLVLLTILVPELLADGASFTGLLRGLLPTAIAGGAGIGALVFSGLRLPAWIKERDAQFEAIADRLQRSLIAPTKSGPES